MRRKDWLAFLVLTLWRTCAEGGSISPAGERLAAFLDGMDVKTHWLSERYVKWQTGEEIDRPVTDGKPHTHCSAFVAAACMRMGVYILRPPEHSESYLASAQFDWLRRDGSKEGWKPVRGALAAQRLANDGWLVVASCKEMDPKKPGHIAIIRPFKKSAKRTLADGPQVIQAGGTNYRSAKLKAGFKSHPSAWRKHKIRFFAHRLDWNTR